MLRFVQDETPKDAAAERDPREELLGKARKKFSAGDFVGVRTWLEQTIDEAVEETLVLKPIREDMKPDPGAIVVASVCGLGLLVIVLLTLFH
jgi:hypothetical protein